MTKQKVTPIALAIAVLVWLSSGVLAHSGPSRQKMDERASEYGASLDARQHGYEHAYRAGEDRGRQDHDQQVRSNYKTAEYDNSGGDHEAFFGDKEQYVKGYRDGYKAGYGDGYNGRAGRYSRIYGRLSDPNQVAPPGDVYADRGWGAADMAIDVGYRDGITVGQRDQARNVRSNFQRTEAYQSADHGYRPTFGDKDAYKTQFQASFDRGYQDGFRRTRFSNPAVPLSDDADTPRRERH